MIIVSEEDTAYCTSCILYLGILSPIRFYCPLWWLKCLSLLHPLGEQDNSASLFPLTWLARSSREELSLLLAYTVLKAMETQLQSKYEGVICQSTNEKKEGAAKLPLKLLSESKTLKISPRSFCEPHPSLLPLPLWELQVSWLIFLPKVTSGPFSPT